MPSILYSIALSGHKYILSIFASVCLLYRSLPTDGTVIVTSTRLDTYRVQLKLDLVSISVVSTINI